MKNKLRVLFLGTNREYFNHSIQLFPLAVASFTEMIFYGPGYQTKEVLDEGIESFIEHIGQIDLLFTDGVIFFYKNLNPFKASFNYFIPEDNVGYIQEMKSYFVNSEIKKILYPSIDFYNVSKEEINLLEKSKAFLIAWGKEFHEFLKDCPTIKNESFGANMNDNWINFVLNNEDRIISVPQIVNNDEFNFNPIKNKEYDISIPGASYYHRREARRIIKGTNIKNNNTNSGIRQKLFYFLVKQKNKIAFNIVNTFFQRTISTSKIVFTCGGCLKYPVRKFFEIPALGSAMFCVPCKGMEELGFIDKINCIYVDDLDTLKDKVQYYLSNTDKLQEIASQGQKLVWEKHSFTARVTQIKQSLEEIQKGSFKGSYWNNGEFYLR